MAGPCAWSAEVPGSVECDAVAVVLALTSALAAVGREVAHLARHALRVGHAAVGDRGVDALTIHHVGRADVVVARAGRGLAGRRFVDVAVAVVVQGVPADLRGTETVPVRIRAGRAHRGRNRGGRLRERGGEGDRAESRGAAPEVAGGQIRRTRRRAVQIVVAAVGHPRPSALVVDHLLDGAVVALIAALDRNARVVDAGLVEGAGRVREASDALVALLVAGEARGARGCTGLARVGRQVTGLVAVAEQAVRALRVHDAPDAASRHRHRRRGTDRSRTDADGMKRVAAGRVDDRGRTHVVGRRRVGRARVVVGADERLAHAGLSRRGADAARVVCALVVVGAGGAAGEPLVDRAVAVVVLAVAELGRARVHRAVVIVAVAAAERLGGRAGVDHDAAVVLDGLEADLLDLLREDVAGRGGVGLDDEVVAVLVEEPDLRDVHVGDVAALADRNRLARGVEGEETETQKKRHALHGDGPPWRGAPW